MQEWDQLPIDDWEPNEGELDQLDPPSPTPSVDSHFNQHRELYPSAAHVYGKGHTFMDVFDADPHADKREENLYYPFASKQDWEMASWLLRSGLSMTAIDQFLRLQLVSRILHRPS
jgi:hypothetical protein